jgi:hypothetical protein
MGILAHNEEVEVLAGRYNLKFVSAGAAGTATVNFKTNNTGDVQGLIPDVSLSGAADGGTLELPRCHVQAVITGDGQVFINVIEKY